MLFKPILREPEQGTCNFHMKRLMQETLEGFKGEVAEEIRIEEELEEVSWSTEGLIEAMFSAITASVMDT